MKKIFLLVSALSISACQTIYQSRPDIMTYRETQQVSYDDEVVKWRRAKGIPLAASIAITQNNNIEILQENTRPYTLGPTIDPYIRDFAPCYLRREAFIAGKHVVLEVPCRHRPLNDEPGSIFNHRAGSPFPGAHFDVRALQNID